VTCVRASPLAYASSLRRLDVVSSWIDEAGRCQEPRGANSTRAGKLASDLMRQRRALRLEPLTPAIKATTTSTMPTAMPA
jgi:hypothetical protein